MLDGFHVGDHVLGLEVFDGAIERGVVEVRFGFDCFGPEPVFSCFVDEGVDDLMFGL